MRRDHFENWYKEQFEGLSEEPPHHVWENIDARLDTEMVWNKINSSLDRKEQNKRRYVTLFVFVAVLGLTLFLTYTPGKVRQLASSGNLPGELNGTDPLVASSRLAATPETSGVTINSGNTNGTEYIELANKTSDGNSLIAGQQTTTGNDAINAGLFHIAQEAPRAFVAGGTDKNYAHEFLHFPSIPRVMPGAVHGLMTGDLEITPDTIQSRSRFVVGASCVGSFSGLVNAQLVNSFKKRSTNSASILPDASGEIFGEGIFKDQYGIGVFACWSSDVHQTYKSYYEGEFMSDELRLKQFKAGIYSSWYFDRDKKNGFGPENCLYAGITGNFISEKLYSGKEDECYNPEYLKDFYPGVVVGIRKYKMITPGFYLHGSASAEAGLFNIYAGQPGIPKQFYTTHIVTFSASLGISYRFTTK